MSKTQRREDLIKSPSAGSLVKINKPLRQLYILYIGHGKLLSALHQIVTITEAHLTAIHSDGPMIVSGMLIMWHAFQSF